MSYELLPVAVASDYIRELLREFPFAEDGGRSLCCQVAAMMSRFAFSLLPRSAQIPFVIWNANGPRAGKTLLAKIVEIPVRGYATIQPLPEEKEELRKLLESHVISGAQSIIFDNVKGRIDSPTLEAFATSSVFGGRRMGGNRIFNVLKQTMVMLTSNQCEVSPDIAGRSIFIDLFVTEADPQARKIDHVIGDSYLERPEIRFAILSALWSMIVHWDKVGRPAASSRLAGFEEWGAIIGGIVEAAGFGDPLRKPKSEDFGDPDMADMVSLVDLMVREEMYSDGLKMRTREGVSFDDLITICREKNLFESHIRGKVNRESKEFEIFPASRSKLGKLFAGYSGRVFRLGEEFGTVKFERVGNKNHRQYRVA